MRVVIEYFKESGKWYSSAEYETSLTVDDGLWLVWEELRKMLSRGERPGLIEGKHEFNTLVRVPEHPHDHLHMIMAASLEAR